MRCDEELGLVTEASNKPLLEVGWIVAGKLDPVDVGAMDAARVRLIEFLQQQFPDFSFEMPVIHREELVHAVRVEPVVMLDHAVLERNVRHWDYSLVITNADLIGHYKREAYAALSRTLESAVVSTARIDPKAVRGITDESIRLHRMQLRIFLLALHCLGHLMGLDHDPDPANVMYDVTAIQELDGDKSFNESQKSVIQTELSETADHRLEETSQGEATTLAFYARAAWLNRREILDAIIDAKSWLFPFRLSRLTAAATSAMLVLLVTAEVWELGTHQDWVSVGGMSLLATISTTAYIILRQRLFARRERATLSEQNVVTNIATCSIVFTGMLTTYGFLFAGTVLLSVAFFDTQLVRHWTNEDQLGYGSLLLLAGFIASLGIFIGSLGVSFEDQHYFRHITFVDEEV